MKKITAIAFLVFTSCFFAGVAFAAPQVGEPAPDFTLIDSNGQTRELSEFRGKHVVLEWLNHGCPFVTKFYASGKMQALQKEVTEAGDVWLVINTSAPGKQGHLTAEEANEVSKEKGAHQTALLLDHDGKVGRLYEAKTTPQMFVINPEGTLVYNGAMDSIPSTNIADLEKAENYVMAALEASRAGKPVSPAVTRPYGCDVKY